LQEFAQMAVAGVCSDGRCRSLLRWPLQEFAPATCYM